ncbi:hypothetical protein D4765_00580 [Subtercola vilae]|uniref:Uncharacterized protein n=1 Tax=Subtercola vilae TaxID=2056433 RepID=A0A4T2C8Z7_9MICO|nr:hypothetical protein D4765_00580 [Subtercola vilae]
MRGRDGDACSPCHRGELYHAITEMVELLREYVEDWQDHLVAAPNHAGNWGLVQLIVLSTDDQALLAE